MFLTYGISAPVQEKNPIDKPSADDRALLEAEYICSAMYETIEEALGKAVNAVATQFAVVPGDVRIWSEKKADGGYDFFLGHTGYAPLGVKRIPLMYVEALNGTIQETIKHNFLVERHEIVHASGS